MSHGPVKTGPSRLKLGTSDNSALYKLGYLMTGLTFQSQLCRQHLRFGESLTVRTVTVRTV